MKKAWAIGASVLVAAFAAWLLLLRLQIYSWLMLAVLWASPLIASFVVAYLSPARKALLGTTMAIPAAVFAVLLNWIEESRGVQVDFPGSRGALILFGLVLAVAVVLSTLGGIAGALAARARS